MKKLQIIFAVTILSSVLMVSCKPDIKEVSLPKGKYSNGIFVINEGSFGSSNGSVGFIHRDNSVAKDIFQNVNSRPLGDVVQSMAIHNDKAYVVVNNSNKVEVVNSDNFQSLSTIEGVNLPRYFIGFDNNKGYLTEWVSFSGNGAVKVIDLNTNNITKTIPVGVFPEKMAIYGNKLYVTNWGEKSISVINTVTDLVETTIQTSDAPNGISIDESGNILVLCEGKKWTPDFTPNTGPDANSKFDKFDSNGNILSTFTFASVSSSAKHLIINDMGKLCYFLYNSKICTIDMNTMNVDTNGVVKNNFYALGFDPVSNYILGGKATFNSSDYVYRYTTQGALVDSLSTGVGPNSFVVR